MARVAQEMVKQAGVDLDKLVELLVANASAELTTFYYYTILRVNLIGLEGEGVKEIAETARIEDRNHFEALVPRIYELGGKLPGDTIEKTYSLEYGEATLEIHKSDLTPGKNWLVIDDLIATGGTLQAVCHMVEHQGGKVAGIFSIIGLPFLNYMEKIAQYNPKTLIDFQGE